MPRVAARYLPNKCQESNGVSRHCPTPSGSRGQTTKLGKCKSPLGSDVSLVQPCSTRVCRAVQLPMSAKTVRKSMSCLATARILRAAEADNQIRQVYITGRERCQFGAAQIEALQSFTRSNAYQKSRKSMSFLATARILRAAGVKRPN